MDVPHFEVHEVHFNSEVQSEVQSEVHDGHGRHDGPLHIPSLKRTKEKESRRFVREIYTLHKLNYIIIQKSM